MHHEFAPVAFIAAFSLLLPLPWHWRAGNVATIAIIFWLFVSNFIYAIDAIIWGNSVDTVVPVWCDITTKIIIGANFALPAACLCICIHLEKVASVRLARSTQSEKRQRQIFEICMCFGLPVVFMALHFIVQGHRFDIIEEYGCRPTTYFSIPAIFIVWLPPLLLAIGALVFGALALRHFMVRRVSFAGHLTASHTALTTSRYLRLMLMSVLQMLWSISITSYTLWFTVMAVPIRPWTTWADVHSDFSRIDAYPAEFTPQIVKTSYYVLWWMVPASTYIFVAFFAFGHDAMNDYKSYLQWFRRHVLRQANVDGKSKGSFGAMPSPDSPNVPLNSKAVNNNSECPLLPYEPSPYSLPQGPYSQGVDGSDSTSHCDHVVYDSGSYSHEGKPQVFGSVRDFSPPSPPVAAATPAAAPWQTSTISHIRLPPSFTPPEPLAPPPRAPPRAYKKRNPSS